MSAPRAPGPPLCRRARRRRASRPSWTIPPGVEQSHRYRNIVVAYDETEGARAALRRAAGLAELDRASLTLVQAGVDEAHARRSLESAASSLDPSLEASPWVVAGPAGKGILAVAGEIHADLIACGSRARGPIGRAVLGSVSTELVHDAPCDVLVVHPVGD